MVDRQLTFSDTEVISMLQDKFVAAAIDQFEQRKQKDAEGEFYRKVAGQGPRKDFNLTTQGRYICTAGGTLLGYNNNRGSEALKKQMKQALQAFEAADDAKHPPIDDSDPDPEFFHRPPKDGLILRVNAQVLDGYEPTNNWKSVFHNVVSRDNAWFTKQEARQIIDVIETGNEFPPKLAQRIGRFHLVDNTRGEPPRWDENEIRLLKMKCNRDGRISGSIHLETADHQRGYKASLLGFVEHNDQKIERFDLVCKGNFWGSGRFTHHGPRGVFPLAISFRLLPPSDRSAAIIPHGAKGWFQGYFE